MLLAKSILACLLNDETPSQMDVRAFTLMPNHLHFLAGVRVSEVNLLSVIGNFKSYTTQSYWKRSHEVVESEHGELPSRSVIKGSIQEARPLLNSLIDWRATLRPEIVELRNWPAVKPEHFLKKHLWQTRFYDHVIRNEDDLRENLNYIAMNPVREGYVSQPYFYPYTGFLF